MTTPSDRPVFVDPSGRRRKVMRIGTVAESVINALAGAVVRWQKLKRTGSAAQDAPELDERTVPLNRRELVR